LNTIYLAELWQPFDEMKLNLSNDMFLF